MKFVLFVEGYTERKAVGAFLKRWLDSRTRESIGIKVVRFDGWPEMVKDMPKKAKMHLAGPDGHNVIAVLALLDLYGPTFYPSHLSTSRERLEWATQEMQNKVGDARFRMFFAVHELEAWLLVEMIDPGPVEGRGATDQSVDLVVLGEQELGEVGAVLAGDAGDECAFHGWYS